MQRRQRFVADQRFDLPQYKSMINLIEDEFQAYNVHFLSGTNYVVKNWIVENNGGLEVRVSNTNDSLLFNFERTDYELVNLRKSGEELLTASLADNSINYVEVQIAEQGCAPDTVAIWDTIANSGLGQEFTQTVDTITEQFATIVTNTVSFTGDEDKIPLATVTTSGGAIVDIQDSRNLYFHLDSDWDFGVTRTDKTITSIKESYDAVTTAIKEMKGLPNWYDAPGPSFLNLLERMNYILNGGGTITWDVFPDRLEWSADLFITVPSQSFEYRIIAGIQNNFQSGEVLYVTLPEEGVAPAGPLTPTKIQASNYEIDAANSRNYIIAYRAGTRVYFGNSWTNVELESGEGNQLGDGITSAWITATGLTDEMDDSPAYTSTSFVLQGQSFVTAISVLDSALNTLNGLVTGPIYQESQSLTITAGDIITLPNSQAYKVGFNDLEVYIDGQLKFPSADYNEINDGAGVGTTIEVLDDYPADTLLTFRIQIGGGQVAVPIDIFDEVSLIEAELSSMTFEGNGVEATTTGSGNVKVKIQAKEVQGEQVVGNGGSVPLVLSDSLERYIRVSGSGGPVTTSSNVIAGTNFIEGTTFRLVGVSDTNTVTVPHNDISGGALLKGSVDATLGRGNVITLVWDAIIDRFIELSRNF